MKSHSSGMAAVWKQTLLTLSLICGGHIAFGQSPPRDSQSSNQHKGAVTERQPLTDESAEALKMTASDELKIIIWPQFSQLRKYQSASVTVHVENNSGEDLSLSGKYFFELVKQTNNLLERERETYSSWVRLQEHLGPAGKTRQETLGSGETLEVKLDLAKLLWSQAISSNYPVDNLFQVVPGANYNLRFVTLLEYKKRDGQAVRKRVSSNDILVFVDNDLK